MGFTLILATFDGLDVGLLGDVIGEDDYDDDDMDLLPRDPGHLVFRFRALNDLMAEGLSGRMLMEHRDAQGQGVELQRRAGESLFCMGLHTAERWSLDLVYNKPSVQTNPTRGSDLLTGQPEKVAATGAPEAVKDALVVDIYGVFRNPTRRIGSLFEGLEYTDVDSADFEGRIGKIYDRGVHRVLVFDFEGLIEEMAEGLSTRMLMEHKDAQGQSIFTSHA
ncbi:hypothetical protein Tco_1525537 [Tanacetum coccineum]